MHELGVGRKRHRLRLHGGIDDHLGEVQGLGGAGARRCAQALLNQRDELLFGHPRAPARQRRPIERQFVAKELLTAKEFEVRVSRKRAHRSSSDILCVCLWIDKLAISLVGSGCWPGLSE
jgi:hypothetical protein